ncbi:MAG: 6-bladed beta-propeller [Longimicrobiales bacterium]
MRHLLLFTAVAAITACGTANDDTTAQLPATQVRDSAGARVVENARPTWSEDEAWRVGPEPVVRILGSDGGGENLLLDPISLDVDPDGRIIVADGDQAGWDAILVYDRDGRFLFQAGREGEGPGEFGQLWWASAYRGDSIVGFDMATDRLNVFSPEGEFVRQVPRLGLPRRTGPPGTMGFTDGVDAAYDDGHFLAYPGGWFDLPEGTGLGWTKRELLRMAPDGARWDTLGTFSILEYHWDGSRQRQVLFSPYPFHAPYGQSFYYGLGESFEIRRYGPTGDLQLVIRKEHRRRPVTDELREQFLLWYTEQTTRSVQVTDAMIERTRRTFDGAPWGDSLPAFSDGFVDSEGYLWVENYRWMGVSRAPVDGPTVWSVFDSTGVWLGDVETPPGLIVHDATEDRVYGVVVGEYDVKEIEVYPLVR